MDDAKIALEKAQIILDGITGRNFEAALGKGPLEDSAFFKIGEAMGEINNALIAINAHDEVYGFPRCNRDCVDRRAA